MYLKQEKYHTDLLKKENKFMYDYVYKGIYTYLDVNNEYIVVAYIDKKLDLGNKGESADYLLPLFELMYSYGRTNPEYNKAINVDMVPLQDKFRVVIILSEDNPIVARLLLEELLAEVAKYNLVHLTSNKYSKIRTDLKKELTKDIDVTMSFIKVELRCRNL